jgi:hypothetical protein
VQAGAEPSAFDADIAAMISSLPDAEPAAPSGIVPLAPPSRVPIETQSSVRQPAAVLPLTARKTHAPIRKKFADESSPASVGGPISRQIIEFLEKQNLFAVSQLRIEVHNGVVVVTGDVSSVYEKQLLAHFCRQVPGVAKFVDSTRVHEAQPAPVANGPVRIRRAARQPFEWRLPFRFSHMGIAAGVLVLVWGAVSLGFGRGRPERLAVYPVTGSLLVGGQPAAGATIVLHPQDPSLSARPRATVEPDGSIIVTTYEPGDGAPAGEYKATVEWRRPVEGQVTGDDSLPPPNVLPAAYASPRTTPVTLIIEEGENEFPILNFPN